METYEKLKYLKNNICFEQFSKIYLDEFFMYVCIKSIHKDVFPTIDIYNILSTIPNELFKNINDTLFTLNYNSNLIQNINFKYFYEEKVLEDNQNNLIRLMKDIFNHNCISEKIKKIRIRIKYNNYDFNLDLYNNDKLSYVKSEIHNYILSNYNIKINTNRIILKYNNMILKDKDLDFYNIKNDSLLYVLINMNNKLII